MTEQQEQSDEPGLAPAHDLDPSKEDDGHVRQASLSHTHAICAVMGSSPPGGSSFLHLFGGFILAALD